MKITKSAKFGNGFALMSGAAAKTNSADIFKMMSRGYVRAVSDARMNLLQFDKLEAIYLTGEKPSSLMDYIHKRFWAPFLADAYRHRTSIGICVFRIVEAEFEVESQMRKERVPEALPEGSFEVTPTINQETGNVEFSVSQISKFGARDDEVYVLHFIYKKGPSPYSDIIDSDAGILLEEWKKLGAYETKEAALWNGYLRPWMYCQRTVMPTNVQHTVESARSNDLLNPEFRPDESGFNGPSHPHIEFDERTGVAYVPIGHSLTKRSDDQPSVQLFEQIKYREKQFHRLVDQTMSMSYQNIEADTGGLHSRSEAAVDEARASTTTTVSTIISDLSAAMQLVHSLIYSDSPEERIVVSIPSRSLVTFKNLYDMLDKDLISQQVAAEEAGKISAIHSSRMNLGKKRVRDGKQKKSGKRKVEEQEEPKKSEEEED